MMYEMMVEGKNTRDKEQTRKRQRSRLVVELLDLLPRELLATKVATGGGLLVDGVPEVELLHDNSGAEVKVVLDDLDELGVALDTSAVGVDEQAEGLSNTDDVRELVKRKQRLARATKKKKKTKKLKNYLNEGTLGEAGSDERLGDPAGSVGSRAIDLGPVLAGEGATTVGTPTTVGVDDDLAASDTGITLGATDDELARLLEVVDGLLVDELLGEDDVADLLLELLLLLFELDLGGVLGRDDDGVDVLGNAGTVLELVLDGDLGLRVGAEPAHLAVLAELSHLVVELVGKHEGHGHELGGLVGGIAKHDTLFEFRS